MCVNGALDCFPYLHEHILIGFWKSSRDSDSKITYRDSYLSILDLGEHPPCCLIIGYSRQLAFFYIGMDKGILGSLNAGAKNIKVNAICPGNYLDGPLWTDPVKGLFVQYLEDGKVPGAKTVEDVRRFYEAKVPMNRGCLPLDVARAVMYCVEQKYETGQAIPVTGGQVMLN